MSFILVSSGDWGLRRLGSDSVATPPGASARTSPQLSQEHLHHSHHVHLNPHRQLRGIVGFGVHIVDLQGEMRLPQDHTRALHGSALDTLEAGREREDLFRKVFSNYEPDGIANTFLNIY